MGLLMQLFVCMKPGNLELQEQMAMHFILPNDTHQSGAQLFDSYLYLTQVMQSMCYSTALSLWRRSKNQLPAHTMGIIYWQVCQSCFPFL